jgi:hypothetical protein
MSGKDDERPDASSSVCYAKDADPAYMGYFSREELIAFLNTMLEAERAGAAVALKSAHEASAPDVKSLLGRVHHDEAQWCAMLLRHLGDLGGMPSAKTGVFREKAMALPDIRERLTFLNRGQEWVVRKLKEALPKVRDDALHRDLSVMLTAHEENIRRTAAVLGTPVTDV